MLNAQVSSYKDLLDMDETLPTISFYVFKNLEGKT